jgi:hypothetical protein
MYSNGGSYPVQDRYQAPPAAYQQGYSGPLNTFSMHLTLEV